MRRRCIGLVREAYSKWERRAPLTPSQVESLVRAQGIDVLVQPSKKRIFSDAEYKAAGAVVTDDLSDAAAVFGVKQVPVGELMADKTYMFFSHTIKGQAVNMPLLETCLARNIRLIDYECVRENGNRSAPRLIAFGEFAGKAGMVEGLRGLGARLLALGYSTPFLSVGPAYSYPGYQAACDAVRHVGRCIKEHGLPAEFAPLVFGFAGRGNVATGAKDLFAHLGDDVVEWVSPEALPELSLRLGTEGEHTHRVYGCEFGAEWLARPRDVGQAFDRLDYYAHPEQYDPIFHEAIAPHLSCLVTTMYWDRRFPRMLTTAQQRDIQRAQTADPAWPSPRHGRLLAIADITCDVAGAVEFLVRDSTVEEPFYLYDVEADREARGLDGKGVLMMGVDILPSELPREASHHFGTALMPFIPALLESDPSLPWAEQGGPGGLPPELYAATITSGGSLTPAYAYIREISRTFAREAAQAPSTDDAPQLQGSTVLSLRGHLFDSGLINRALDVVEQAEGRFYLLEISVVPNVAGESSSAKSKYITGALLQVTVDRGRPALEEVIAKVQRLAAEAGPSAEAEVAELPDFCGGVYDKTLFRRPAGDLPELGAAAGEAAVAVTERVAILGAGMCAGPAVEYLCRESRRSVTIVSAVAGEAQALAAQQHGPGTCKAMTISCTPAAEEDWAALLELLREADAVLSLLPATMHAAVARACIEAGTPMVTASYVSPEMSALSEAAESKGVPVLCEMGLDPGMDHMSAMRVISQAQAAGGRVREFRSVCGGLPAPEAADNPLMYKFSWSPAGVLAAAENGASYKEEGQVVTVAPGELLGTAVLVPKEASRLGRVLNLEVLPNRDSLPYGEIYGIPEADTIFRGTLRYGGWSSIMEGFKALGLLDGARQLPPGTETWAQLAGALGLRPAGVSASDGSSVGAAVAALEWLGAFGDRPVSGDSVRQAFCALLADRLSYGDEERDAVFLEHSFAIDWPGGTQGIAKGTDEPYTELVSSSFVGFGEPNGKSAMAKTVGLTAAIGVRLMLERGAAVGGGVHIPTDPKVFDFCLDRLAEEGIVFSERSVRVERPRS